MSCQRVGCKYLHSSLYPPSSYEGSTLPVYHKGTAPASLLGTSVGWKSLVELLCGPGFSAPLLRLLVTFLRVKGKLLAEKNYADNATEATNCYHKGDNRAMNYLEQLLGNTNLD